MRILAINDISCVGKCSLAATLPIISACGIECNLLPTAILSTHTGGFDGYTFHDLTKDIPSILEHWKTLGLTFDYIYSGYLGSVEQIDMVLQIQRDFLKENGKLIVADDLWAAIDIANELAPEHLELCVDNPFDYLDAIRHAGSIFMGRHCPEALGDYLAGPNHTLPTGGTAKFSSPLSVDDFVKKSQFTYYTAGALQAVAADVQYFANQEGLQAHGKSAVIRGE